MDLQALFDAPAGRGFGVQMRRRELLVGGALGAVGCTLRTKAERFDLEATLYARGDAAFRRVLDRRAQYGLQIIFSSIDRRGSQPLAQTSSLYGEADRWFWPASLIKLPLAALALEQLAAREWSALSTLEFAKRASCVGDPDPMPDSAADDIARLIERALILSDNFAANALYDFLGSELIQRRLKTLGYPLARIVARLAFCTPEQQRLSPAYVARDARAGMIAQVAERRDETPYSAPFGQILRGRGYIENGTLIKQPRDFSNANCLPLRDVHQMLMAVVRPELVEQAQRFKLRETDRLALVQTLAALPRERGFAEADFPDAWCKFLLYGDHLGRIPPGVRIHNKIGQAYGYLSDTAYFHEPASGLEFFLSALIYVNADGIFNDDRYEYETIGLPFLAQLGRIVLEASRQAHHSG